MSEHFEIHPVVLLDPDDGSALSPAEWPTMEMQEDCGDGTALYCWTVYRKLPWGGIDAIADCPTREDAEMIAAALERP